MAHRFGLTIKTRLTYDELDNVVGQYCQGEYSISLGGLDESSASRRKIMLVWFDKIEDRDRLKSFFAMRTGQPAPPGMPMPKPGTAAA
jgi:hypothetical protein